MKKQRRDPIVLSQMRPLNLLLVLCGCILFTFACIHFSSLWTYIKGVLSALGPVLAGLVFAYLLNPLAVRLERHFTKRLSRIMKNTTRIQKIARVASACVAVLCLLAVIGLLVAVTFSQVIDSMSTFLQKLPGYVEMAGNYVEKWIPRDSSLYQYGAQLIGSLSNLETVISSEDTKDMTQKILSQLAAGAAGTFGLIYDVLIGMIVAIYLLISKERFVRQFKRILFAFVKSKTAFWIYEQMRKANKTFATAVLGKSLECIVVGILCFFGLLIMDAPYSVLISVIIGVTDIIPFFGPIIGAIPCILLILMEDPLKAVYFAIFILVLQQFDGNVLEPKIVGTSVGLPAFWELFACLLGGGLFGVIGMALGVPVFAVLYHLIRELVSERLQDRDLPPEFLEKDLGVEPTDMESGLFDTDQPESQYVQRWILLEEIAPKPTPSSEDAPTES